jgi:hypothetical protein
MAAIGQGGILGFGPQHDKEVAVGPVGSPNWMYHKAGDINLAPQDDQRVFPSEIGGRPTPSGAYKAGIMTAGGFTINPRLKNTMGWLLYGALGNISGSHKALVYTGVMSGKKVTSALQTITTGLSAIPTPARKLVVRLWKGDNVAFTGQITIVGKDQASTDQTETFDFSTGPAAGQRTDGLDTNPSDSIFGYEALVGAKEYASITSVAIPAVAGIGSDVINVTVGFEDAVGMTHDFEMDSVNPSKVPWFGFRKYIPPGNDGIGLGETYEDCKIAGMTLTYPNDGIINARVDALGRKFKLERNPTWATGVSYEDYESVPIGSVIGGYLRTPFFGEQNLSVVGATVAWQNAPLDPRSEKVYGSPWLEDITIVGRSLSVDLVVKWVNPDLYQKILTNSVTGEEWSAVPFTTRLDLLSVSPALMPGSLLPYSLRTQAQKVMLAMRGGVELAAGNAIMMRFSGVALDIGGTFAKFSLTNLKAAADYVWPAD